MWKDLRLQNENIWELKDFQVGSFKLVLRKKKTFRVILVNYGILLPDGRIWRLGFLFNKKFLIDMFQILFRQKSTYFCLELLLWEIILLWDNF